MRKSEKICCWVCACVLVGDGSCLVDKKGQENARKSGHVFLCLKSRSVFFGVLVEDEHRS